MEKLYDNFLFDESGHSISLSADDLIAYLLDCLHEICGQKDALQSRLDLLSLILGSSLTVPSVERPVVI